MQLADTVQRHIERLGALPIQPVVVLRLIELGRNPQAEVRDYVQIIQADTSLSSRLLGLTNSAWFGLSRKVTTIKLAVPLLGIRKVRALAVSYCLTGLHSTLKLDPDDSRAFWEAALCKAVAAKLLVESVNPKRADEAFTMGLFQDIGVGIFAAAAGKPYTEQLQRSDFAMADQLAYEESEFGMPHSACGKLLGEKLDLPEPYLSAIASHHDEKQLENVLSDVTLARAVFTASLFPHDMRSWKPNDIAALGTLLTQHFSAKWPTPQAFIEDVEAQFRPLVNMLCEGEKEAPSLTELIEQVSAENARMTTDLVGQMSSLAVQTLDLTRTVDALSVERTAAEHRATHDTLTGLFNREGFLQQAREILERASVAEHAIAMVIFDLDRFKEVNDTHGHRCGDTLLQTVARRLRTAVRENELVCRWGGDEIVVFLEGLQAREAVGAALRFKKAVERSPVAWRNKQLTVSMTGGVRWIERIDDPSSLTDILEEADQALYQAKRTRRGTIVCWWGEERITLPVNQNAGG